MNNPHPNNPNTNTKNTENNPARLNPRTWTKKTRIIAAGTTLALVLGGVGVGFAYHHYSIDRDCKAVTTIFNDQKTSMNDALRKADEALRSVDAALKVEKDGRLAHTDGFTQATDGKKVIADLTAARYTVKNAGDETSSQCSNNKALKALTYVTSTRQSNIDALTAQIDAFVKTRDAYRLDKAAKEAHDSMEKAKTELAAAQKEATDQLAAVDNDASLKNDGSVSPAYNDLKKVENDSHSVSTTVTTSTYDNAVASIDKAKKVVEKATEVTTATQALKDAVQNYHNAKAAAAAPSSSRTNSAVGYTNNGSNYNSGYTAPSYTNYTDNYTPNVGNNFYNPLPSDGDVLHMSLEEIEAGLKANCGANFEKCQ